MSNRKFRGVPAPVLLPGTRLRVSLPWTALAFVGGLYLAIVAAVLLVRLEIRQAVQQLGNPETLPAAVVAQDNTNAR